MTPECQSPHFGVLGLDFDRDGLLNTFLSILYDGLQRWQGREGVIDANQVATAVAAAIARAEDIETDRLIGQNVKGLILQGNGTAFIEAAFDDAHDLAVMGFWLTQIVSCHAEVVSPWASAADAHTRADFDQAVIGRAEGHCQVQVRIFQYLRVL